MQQRQPRLGDILDDYCPRERRVTNHAVVAMVGDDVKQTRCTTCEADHEYKHAKIPRQRKKSDTPAALTSQILAGAPKRVVHDEIPENGSGALEDSAEEILHDMPLASGAERVVAAPSDDASLNAAPDDDAAPLNAAPEDEDNEDEGPVHRPLIRASLPRPEGHPPPARPIPEFTIRQPGGRQNRFRPRHGGGGQQGRYGQQGGQPFQGGNRSNGGRGDMRSGRGPQGSMPRGGRRHGPGGGGRNKPSK